MIFNLTWSLANLKIRIASLLCVEVDGKAVPEEEVGKATKVRTVTACDLAAGAEISLRSSEKPKRRWRIEVGRHQD